MSKTVRHTTKKEGVSKKTGKKLINKKAVSPYPKMEGMASSKVADKAAISSWDSMFGSKVIDDIREKIEYFIEGASGSLCHPTSISNNATGIAKDMINRLSNNLRHSFEQNMELSQSILKCKTASDVIEFGRKQFELNYKNTVKLYSDFFHDIQSLTNQNIQDTARYTNKQTKSFVS